MIEPVILIVKNLNGTPKHDNKKRGANNAVEDKLDDADGARVLARIKLNKH